MSNQAPVLTTAAADGVATVSLGTFNANAASLAVQVDGKIIVRANAWSLDAGALYSELARYNADGSLDTTFGTNGVVMSPWNVTTAFGPEAGVALQADGKIVAGGDGFSVARYNSDGSLDTSFGTGGKISGAQIGSTAYGIEVEPDGKIIASGDSSNFGLVRYDSSGHLDSSFGTGGKATASFGASFGQAHSFVSQPDGKVVVAGGVFSSGQFDFALARYNADGSLDASFGGAGKVTTVFTSDSDTAFGVTLQADGKIVVAGTAGSTDFALARYNVDGSLDTSFGGTGKVTTDVASVVNEAGESVRIQADGKIVVAGFSLVGPGNNSDFTLVRYNSDGSLDTSFGTGGKVLTDTGTAVEKLTSLLIQPDGTILVVGTRGGAGGAHDLVLMHYNSDGSLDTSFGPSSRLDGPTVFIEDQSPAVLNARATVHDIELAAAGSYDGASLTLARHGGANSEDVFGATGNLAALTEGDTIKLSGLAIGTVTQNSGGALVLTFGAAATEARVNEALCDITYVNTSDAPAPAIQIDWFFSDGNTGAQGSGGALAAAASTTVNIVPSNDAPINTIPVSFSTLADTGFAITGLSMSDPDPVSLVTTLDVDHGTLTVAAAGGATVTSSGTDHVTIIGSVAQINATLAASNNVIYRSAADFIGTDTLTMTTLDGLGIGGRFTSNTATLNVTAVPGTVAIDDVSVVEGNSGSKVAIFTVTRSGGTAPIAVNFATSDGSATTADHDYVAVSGTLSFGAGDTTRTIEVPVNGDTRVELNEAFTVTLSGATNGATISDASGTGLISNDDVVSVGSVAVNDVSISEGNSGTALETFTIHRSGGSAAFDIAYATADGTATVGDGDYIAQAGTLHFDAGVDTQTVSVAIAGDTGFEADETFFFNLSGATNGGTISDGSGTGTIANDDINPAWHFAPLAPQIDAFTPGAGGWTSQDQFPRELADVNGDGAADIVGFGAGGVYVSLAKGDGSFGPLTAELAQFGTSAGGWSSQDHFPRELADVNGDHMADIVGFGAGGVYVSLATGGGSFGPMTSALAQFGSVAGGWASQDQFPRELADLNGDHMADIVGFGAGGVYVSLANGDGSFGPLTSALAQFGTVAGGWASQDQFPRELADVNGDGKVDIAGFGGGGVYLALGHGDGSFGPLQADLQQFGTAAGGWASQQQFPRELADVNHDGAADIVGFGYAGVYEALSHHFDLI